MDRRWKQPREQDLVTRKLAGIAGVQDLLKRDQTVKLVKEWESCG